MAYFLAVAVEGGPGGGHLRAANLQPDQQAIGVTVRLEAGDRFLPDVTALRITDEAVVAAELLGKGRFVDVSTVEGRAGLDAKHLEDGKAGGADGGVVSGEW